MVNSFPSDVSHSQESIDMGSNPVLFGYKSDFLYTILRFQIYMENGVLIANAFILHCSFHFKRKAKIKASDPLSVMIKFIDNYDQTIIAQVFGAAVAHFI